MAALEAGIAWLLAPLDPLKERLIGFVEPGQHILQDVAVESIILGEGVRRSLASFRFLGEAFHRDVAAVPGGLALLEGHVVERATAPQTTSSACSC